MSTTQHTPGPWAFTFAKWHPDGQTIGYTIEANGVTVSGLAVATGTIVMPPSDSFYNPDIHTTPEQAEANARLIAAAPELLEILKELIDEKIIYIMGEPIIDANNKHERKTIVKALSIINKATGNI